MSLIKCNECSAMISEYADACPKCGLGKSDQNKVRLVTYNTEKTKPIIRPIILYIASLISLILYNFMKWSAIYNYLLAQTEEYPSSLASYSLYLFFLIFVLLFFFIFFLFYKLYKGKKWARTIILLTTIINIPFVLMDFSLHLQYSTTFFILQPLLIISLQIIALIRLYSDSSNQWFNSPFKH